MITRVRKRVAKENGLFKRTVAAVLGLSMCCTSVLALKENAYAADMSEFSSGYHYSTEMRGLTASQITADMGAGWNLGNSLESENNETYWGNPKTTKKMIDVIAAKGFKTLRVPVRWDDNYSDPSNYTIDSAYLDRVETVVNYGLANDMYVILNVHHNDLQSKVTTDYGKKQQIKDELSAIWTQVGNRFKNYGDKLIFEVNNEPRCGEDWNGNQGYYDCVNECNEAGRAAIRATGGNNAKRLIMLPTYCASADEPKVAGWKKLANDDMIAVSIHAYLPFDFAYEGNGHSNWTDSDYYELQTVFDRLNSTFIQKGIPVVIGEFGATDKGNLADREKYASVYTGMAKKLGIPCVWWDNHSFGYGGEKFGIFDRNSASFVYGGIADNMVKSYQGSAPVPEPGEEVTVNEQGTELFKGSASASNWGQAVAVDAKKNGGAFDTSAIQSGGYFYVEYDGTKDNLELILQSMSGGAAWAKVNISESGEVNNHYYAKFSGENCISAFGSSDFNGLLDKIYVGATDRALKVYYLSYVGAGKEDGDKYVSLFWGSADAYKWSQALSVMTEKNGGTFKGKDITSNGYFYVEYSGDEKQLELILQSWSGGSEWAKVNACEYGYANGHYFAKYKYSDCVSAFGTSDFQNKLDQIHVGAKEGWIQVYSVCYCYPN